MGCLVKSFAISLMAAAMLFAQERSPLTGSITGGLSIPVDDGDVFSTGFNVSGAAFYDIGQVSIGGKIGFDYHPLNDIGFDNYLFVNGVASDYVEMTGSSSYLSLLPAFRYYIPIAAQGRLFVESGLGLVVNFIDYSIDVFDETISGTEDETDIGFSIALGMDYKCFEIRPEFKVDFTEGDAIKMFSLVAGYAF